jgi:hypothetical protein
MSAQCELEWFGMTSVRTDSLLNSFSPSCAQQAVSPDQFLGLVLLRCTHITSGRQPPCKQQHPAAASTTPCGVQQQQHRSHRRNHHDSLTTWVTGSCTISSAHLMASSGAPLGPASLLARTTPNTKTVFASTGRASHALMQPTGTHSTVTRCDNRKARVGGN